MSPDDLFKRPFPDENYVPPDEADLRKQALEKAYLIAASITSEQARASMPAPAAPPVDRGPLLRGANAVLAVGAALWLFVAPPAWLPQAVSDHRSAEQIDAGLRLTLAMEAARVTAYREEFGRLPRTLAEAGGDTRSVRYIAIDETRFSLSTSDGAASLAYDSTQPLGALLGARGTAP